ncbi:MAG: TonB family protein [Halomonadaceae bacterium]|nr:MAG: TonB family protein [Halomonadaceae bacterium]
MSRNASDGSRARFSLVLAIAFLVHVLALVLAPGPAQKLFSQKTIQVQLTFTGTPQQTTPEPAPPPSEPRLTEVAPVSPPTPQPGITTVSPAVVPQQPTTKVEPATTDKADPAPAASESASSSAPSSDPEKVAQQSTRQLPLLSPYELEIRRYIAREVRYERLLTELEVPHQLTLELQLMRNGALERASIARSSGNKNLDRLARQAALMASPFPAVPEEQKERRFKVELLFNPAAASSTSDATIAAEKG